MMIEIKKEAMKTAFGLSGKSKFLISFKRNKIHILQREGFIDFTKKIVFIIILQVLNRFLLTLKT